MAQLGIPVWAATWCLAATALATPSGAQAPPAAVDVWAGRSVAIPVNPAAPRVRVGIWDSGTDTMLFSDRLARGANGRALVRGYDAFKRREDTPQAVIPPSLLARRSELNALINGLDDLDTQVDSPAARALAALMDSVSADAGAVLEADIERWSGYIHGTAVADAALHEHGTAELVVARMEWWHGTPPEPCWSRELADREAASMTDLLRFLVESGARVVNMSWGRFERSYTSNLEQCAPGMAESERQAIARYSVDAVRAVLQAGMRAAPRVLFVGAAGNEGTTVQASNPATRFEEPNFVLVGALMADGSKADFTNTGPEVTLFANGWRVAGRLPGGTPAFGSGTSMAAPLVTNAAAKMLAVNPNLTGAEVRQLLETSADRNADGLRMLHTARAVEAARAR